MLEHYIQIAKRPELAAQLLHDAIERLSGFARNDGFEQLSGGAQTASRDPGIVHGLDILPLQGRRNQLAQFVHKPIEVFQNGKFGRRLMHGSTL